jgi:hypothetical protein
MPPVYGLPHAVIEPSALRAAKADGSVTAWGGSDANDTVKVNEDTVPESIATSD